MLYRLRQRSHDEGGFTLIELLVVILIIGILAAIAIPSFLNQKNKAYDASAKELARTAQTTAETIGTDNSGEYTKVTAEELNKYEPTIQLEAGGGNAYMVKASGAKGTSNTYEVTTTAAVTGDEFTIKKLAAGTVERLCKSSTTGCSGAKSGTW